MHFLIDKSVEDIWRFLMNASAEEGRLNRRRTPHESGRNGICEAHDRDGLRASSQRDVQFFRRHGLCF